MANPEQPAAKSAEQVGSKRDFAALRASGEDAGASEAIGSAICRARDRVARVLIALQFTPNRVTVLGLALTVAAGVCLAFGAGQQAPYWAHGLGPAGWWPLAALAWLFLAGAADMLDGALARVGKLASRAGGLLDSAVDRFSDIAIYFGCFLYFALQPTPHVTYQVLAIIGLLNALLISYIKARAEDFLDDCTVGYWLRGERFAAVMIGCAVGHVPAVMWQMAVSCAFTVWRRLSYSFFAIRASDAGRPLPARGPDAQWWGRLQLWRHPRGSIAYDFVTGAHIAYIVFAPWIWPVLTDVSPATDFLRRWLGA